MTMLPNIEEAMEDARNGKLSPYWQNNLKRECLHGELSAEERLALSELNCILSETPQWSGEEELCTEMENIGGRVCFCHFWVYLRDSIGISKINAAFLTGQQIDRIHVQQLLLPSFMCQGHNICYCTMCRPKRPLLF